MIRKRWALALAIAVLTPTPALAAEPHPKSAEGDEKLPAQLPSVTIQGRDLTSSTSEGSKLAPSANTGASRVRLPEPPQRRATREDNKAVMVNVTPSTLEQPNSLPGAKLPYTSLTAGYGPLTQYNLGLYDARAWSQPLLGITDGSGQAGWGWSAWRAREELDWTGLGRLGLGGHGFGWDQPGTHGNQTSLYANLDVDTGLPVTGGLDVDHGYLSNPLAATGELNTETLRARGRWHPSVAGEHQPEVNLQGQYRQWGVQMGEEGYLDLSDFWSLSDQVQLEGGLGGGYWGREPILDPRMAFHYRPTPSTHLYASLKTASELPEFNALYLERAATLPNTDLQSERVEGWANVGGSHRLSEALWGTADLGLRRSFRHILWVADATNSGLWQPVNTPGEQWSPTLSAQVQYQWPDGMAFQLGYAGEAVYPLSTLEHALDARLDASFLDNRLGLSLGLRGVLSSLATAQLAGGGTASGVFARARAAYQLTSDLSVGLQATDVPLTVDRIGATYYAPNPWLTLDAKYQF